MNALAKALGVAANRVTAIVGNQRGITADTALRLSRYFGNSAEFWMNLQQHYHLEVTRRDKLVEIETRVAPRKRPDTNPTLSGLVVAV